MDTRADANHSQVRRPPRSLTISSKSYASEPECQAEIVGGYCARRCAARFFQDDQVIGDGLEILE